MHNRPRWFLLSLSPHDREYVRDRLSANRYRFEDHPEGFLIFARTIASFAQWLSKQGIRVRTIAAPIEAAA